MSVTSLIPQQPAPQPQAQTPAAALQLVKASLEALAAKLGQTLSATVLGTDANGLTQLKLGAETLTVKLTAPLPAGTQISVTVQPSPNGTPALVIQPLPTPVAQQQMPMPAHVAPVIAGMPSSPPLTVPVPASAAAPIVAQAAAPTPATTAPTSAATPTQATIAGTATPTTATQPAASAAALPATGSSPAPVPASSSSPSPAGGLAPSVGPAAQAASVVQAVPAPSAAPALPAGVVAAQPTVAAAMHTATAASPAPAPVQAAGVAARSASTPVPAAPATQPATAAAAQVAATPTATAPSGSTAPATPVVGVPIAPAAAPAPTTAPAVQMSAAAPQAIPAAAPMHSAPAPSATSATPMPVFPTAATTAPALPATFTQAPAPAGPHASTSAAPSPGQAATLPVTATRPAAPSLSLPLAQPAQAAARQDSIAPLLQNLGVLQGKLASFPQPVVEAAMRLLAARIPLDRGAPGAETLRQAVMRAGVLAGPAAASPAQPADVKSALLQLRAGLLAFLEGGEIAPVAPVARRPPPPLRDAHPRGHRTDAPTLPEAATAREAGRTLLHQTDAALSRLKLTQLASQPQDTRAGAVAARDLIVELPMMLGHELAIAQLQVQRDGKPKGKPGERGWRLRFAVSFSVIGEVGAQVALLGDTTNVVVWAGEPATADALETLMPELGPALAARGLKVGAIKLRRGIPETPRPDTGRLMDQTR